MFTPPRVTQTSGTAGTKKNCSVWMHDFLLYVQFNTDIRLAVPTLESFLFPFISSLINPHFLCSCKVFKNSVVDCTDTPLSGGF